MGVPDSGRSMEERRVVSGINIKKHKTANGQLVLSQRQEMWQKRNCLHTVSKESLSTTPQRKTLQSQSTVRKHSKENQVNVLEKGSTHLKKEKSGPEGGRMVQEQSMV